MTVLSIALDDDYVTYETFGEELGSDSGSHIVSYVLSTYHQFENLFIDEIMSDWKEEINENNGRPMYYFKVRGYFATEEEMEDEDFYPEKYKIYDGNIMVNRD